MNKDWMQTKWRPMMGWMYMIVCIFDFIVFPIGFTAVQFWEVEATNDAFRQWNPITLQGAGLFHMAMGAILGITAWSRGQEKIAGVATNLGGLNDSYTSTSMRATSGQIQSRESNLSSNYSYAEPQQTTSTTYSREVLSVQPMSGYKGKPGPLIEEPEL